MKSALVHYKIEEDEIDLVLEGDTFKGEHITLVNQDTNLIDELNWTDAGYTVEKFLNKKLYEKVQIGISEIVKNLVSIC